MTFVTIGGPAQRLQSPHGGRISIPVSGARSVAHRGLQRHRLRLRADADRGLARGAEDLQRADRGHARLSAFAICFAILLWIWHAHYTFYRRYALHDEV